MKNLILLFVFISSVVSAQETVDVRLFDIGEINYIYIVSEDNLNAETLALLNCDKGFAGTGAVGNRSTYELRRGGGRVRNTNYQVNRTVNPHVTTTSVFGIDDATATPERFAASTNHIYRYEIINNARRIVTSSFQTPEEFGLTCLN